MTDKKINFSVSNVVFTEDFDSSRFASLRVECFATGKNAHDIEIDEMALKNAEASIYNVPLVWHYDSMFDDASGHDTREVPCGFVPRTAKLSYNELEDGRLMFVIDGALLWKKYTGKLMEIFERDGLEKSVSVEISISEYEELGDEKIRLIDFSYDAITILGEFYTPAIPGANVKVVEFAKNETVEFYKAFTSEFLFSRQDYLEVDFTIPNEVKDNIKVGKKVVENNLYIVPSSIYNYSLHMEESDKLSPKKARFILKHSNNYQEMIEEDDSESREYALFMLLGGSNGNEFLSKVAFEMDKVDNKITNYFNLYESGNQNLDERKEEKMSFEKDLDDKVQVEGEVIEENFQEGISDETPETPETPEVPEVPEGESEEFSKDESMMAEDEEQEDEEEEGEEDEEEEGEEENGEAFSEENSEHKTYSEPWMEFALNSSQKLEILNNAFDSYKIVETYGEFNRFWAESFDDEFVYFYDYKEGKMFRASYAISEQNVADVNLEDKQMVIKGNYEAIGEQTEKFSLNSYIDVSAILRFLELETESYANIAEMKVESMFGELIKSVFQKAIDLDEFKKEVEQEKFSLEVEKTIQDVREFMKPSEIDELREDSKNYSIENIDVWKNAVKATAFSKSKLNDNNKVKGIQLPFGNDIKKSNDLWS